MRTRLIFTVAKPLFRIEENRGMNRWRDAVDWIAGYPYEVSTTGKLIDLFKAEGFEVLQLKTTSSAAMN